MVGRRECDRGKGADALVCENEGCALYQRASDAGSQKRTQTYVPKAKKWSGLDRFAVMITSEHVGTQHERKRTVNKSKPTHRINYPIQVLVSQ